MEIDEKIIELIRYMKTNSRKSSKLKIQMLCYFCDVASYTVLGKPITGACYVCGKHGVRMKNFSKYWKLSK